MVAGLESRRPERELSLLQLLMASIAVLLLVYGMALLVVIEFAYRHLIAAPRPPHSRKVISVSSSENFHCGSAQPNGAETGSRVFRGMVTCDQSGDAAIEGRRKWPSYILDFRHGLYWFIDIRSRTWS
jgi:hypothetical protein